MVPISKELLDRFLKGVCTEEEAVAVEAYFQEHPEDISLLDEYEAADAGTPLPGGTTGARCWLSFSGRQPVKDRAGFGVMRAWVGAAAAAVILH